MVSPVISPVARGYHRSVVPKPQTKPTRARDSAGSAGFVSVGLSGFLGVAVFGGIQSTLEITLAGKRSGMSKRVSFAWTCAAQVGVPYVAGRGWARVFSNRPEARGSYRVDTITVFKEIKNMTHYGGRDFKGVSLLGFGTAVISDDAIGMELFPTPAVAGVKPGFVLVGSHPKLHRWCSRIVSLANRGARLLRLKR